MKNKINIFTVTLFAWCISLAFNLFKSYNLYQKEGGSASFLVGMILMVIVWFGLLLIIMDVCHPVSKKMLHKKMAREKLVSYVGLLISDVMLIISIFFITFMVNNTPFLLAFILFTFGRAIVRRRFYAK